MKTVFIYDNPEENIKFFVKDGDYSHLNITYIQGSPSDALERELAQIMYNSEGDVIVDLQDSFPTNLGNQFKVIVVGFLP